MFELWCWRRLLRVPWTARRSNQSIIKEISPEYSLEGLMLKLNLQYFYHLMWRADSFEKTLMLGKIEGRRRRGWQRMDGWMASPTLWTLAWVNSKSWWWTGRPGVLQSMGSQRVRHDWATELNWKRLDKNVLNVKHLRTSKLYGFELRFGRECKQKRTDLSPGATFVLWAFANQKKEVESLSSPLESFQS